MLIVSQSFRQTLMHLFGATCSGKLVEASSATGDWRRMECLRTVTNLDDLHLELKNLGFTLSRSAKYLWFLPRRGNTSKGYGRLQTVPIKLTRPEINLSKRNKDRMFAKSFMDDLINVCKFFGPQSVLLLLNGNKEKVPLGLATASLQAPILMHREYKVRLPVHNFVVGVRHTLIPSLLYSWNIFIRIHCSKHDSSSTYTHAYYSSQAIYLKDQFWYFPLMVRKMQPIVIRRH